MLKIKAEIAILLVGYLSDWYFSHPESRYFGISKVDQDQVHDYAVRKGVPVPEVEKWLGAYLGYESA